MWLRGPLANVMNAIAPILNINFRSRSFAFFPWVRYEWVAAAGGVWGTRLPNGSYNGMVGMVERQVGHASGVSGVRCVRCQEVDLALGPFGMTEARAKVVKFSYPVFYGYYRILVRRPQAQHDPWSFFKPLELQVWIAVLGLTSLLAVRRVPVHINSLQDLVRSPGVPMLLEKDTAFTEHINRSQDGIYKEIRDQSTRLKPIKMEDMERVAAATVMEEDAALLAVCAGECGMMLADETFWPLQLSIIGQRNSNLVDRISPHIRSLVEQDLYNLWLRRELGDYFSCLHKPKKFTINEPISIRTLW
ncbi:Ionotropic receptor 139, partial [Hyalella azteca]